MRKSAAVLFMLLLAPPLILPAGGASLEKARRYFEDGEWDKARKQFSALIRKGTPAERDESQLGLAKIYFIEKDFESVVRSLQELDGSTRLPARLPDSKTGDAMRFLLYSAARAAGDDTVAARQYQALQRSRRIFSMGEIEDHLRLLKRAGLHTSKSKRLQESPAGSWKNTETGRMELTALAESLMSAGIHNGADRIWTALATGGPDDISRTAMLGLGQSLERKGEWKEAERILKLFVLLFPSDPRAADALYRLGSWFAALGSEESSKSLMLAAEFYPGTLYGVMASIDMAWTWPTSDHVQSAIQAIRDARGLPDAVFERGLALALEYPDLLADEKSRVETSQVYRLMFPLGPAAGKINNSSEETVPGKVR